MPEEDRSIYMEGLDPDEYLLSFQTSFYGEDNRNSFWTWMKRRLSTGYQGRTFPAVHPGWHYISLQKTFRRQALEAHGTQTT